MYGHKQAILARKDSYHKHLAPSSTAKTCIFITVTATGEPAYRKELRQKRLRDMHQRMQAQLAEKLARDAAESTEKEEKVDLRSRVVKPKIDTWVQGKKVQAFLNIGTLCIITILM